MKTQLSALIAGLLFGLGLAISQMINPSKVIAFLDVTGNWDPSLALVLFAALAVNFVGWRLTRLRRHPFLARNFIYLRAAISMADSLSAQRCLVSAGG